MGGKWKKRKVEPAETPTLPKFASSAQCAAICGIPLGVIRRAKAAGCDAFEAAGRVSLARLLPWLFKNRDGGEAVDYGQQLKEWQAKREKLKHDKDAGRVLDRDEVRSGIRGAMALLFVELERAFLSELPPTLKGLQEGPIKERCAKAISGLRKTLRVKFAEIGKEE